MNSARFWKKIGKSVSFLAKTESDDSFYLTIDNKFCSMKMLKVVAGGSKRESLL